MNPEKNSIFQGWVSCANFSIHFQATVFQPCIRAFHITSIPMIANSHLDCRGFLIHIHRHVKSFETFNHPEVAEQLYQFLVLDDHNYHSLSETLSHLLSDLDIPCH